MTNPQDIPVVVQFFTPHIISTSFVDMYQAIWASLDTLGFENTALILSQFDVAKWVKLLALSNHVPEFWKGP